MAKDVLKPPVSPGVEPLTHPTTPMGRTPNVRGSCRNGASQDASFDGPSPFGEPPAAEAGEADLADAQSAWALHQGQLCACREARAAAPAEAGQALQGPPPLVKKGRARVDNVQVRIYYISCSFANDIMYMLCQVRARNKLADDGSARCRSGHS